MTDFKTFKIKIRLNKFGEQVIKQLELMKEWRGVAEISEFIESRT